MDVKKIQDYLDDVKQKKLDEIVSLREQIIKLSNDANETRNLLDKLTEAEIDRATSNAFYYVNENSVIETKDFESYSISQLTNGYCIRYKGGYNVFVNNNFELTAGALQMLMQSKPTQLNTIEETNDITELSEEGYMNLANSAIEMIFRLPLFVLSNVPTTFNIATMATMYMNLLQTKGEVPTEDTENPEYDKFLMQMNEMLENFAEGLRKEGEDYERRNGISHEKESENKGENESQG